MGTATATMTYGGVSVSKTFEITKGSRKAPSNLTAIDETIKNKKDGKIEGLTTEMEYSTDGTEFIKVTDPNMNFAPGTYYVRYAESDSYTVSEATTIVINASENKLTVKFVADGKIIKEVSYAYGGTVMSGAIPKTIPEKPGYTVTAPYWDKDVKGMKVYEDITVTAIYTKDILSGDINNDDTVNLYDLVTIAQAQAGWTSINYNREACDTNGDSEFTLDDVTRLAQYLAGYDVTLSKTPFKG